MRNLTVVPMRGQQRDRRLTRGSIRRIASNLAARHSFTPLIEAKAASTLLGVPYTWLLAQAREGKIPHHRLGHYFTGDRDLVFAGRAGGHLDSNQVRTTYHQALSNAGLRRLRFHDLRHTFGTRAVEKAESILELKEWMGHANVQTTMRYLHYKSKADAARRLSEAFAQDEASQAQPKPDPVHR
jgi:integrase